jgi:hypothetical protein
LPDFKFFKISQKPSANREAFFIPNNFQTQSNDHSKKNDDDVYDADVHPAQLLPKANELMLGYGSNHKPFW